jgi:rubrerythrin
MWAVFHIEKLNKKDYNGVIGEVVQSMAIYICGNTNCRFIFERVGEITACPDCGSPNIREAEFDEIQEYERIKVDETSREQGP